MNSSLLEKKPKKSSQPKGLYLLSFCDMWERFSYYGMRSILPLFLTAKLVEGGWGWSDEKSSVFCGIYGTLVCLSAIPGGFIADHYLGLRRAALLGAIIQVIGHVSLSNSNHVIFIWGLFMIAIGTGLFKPNISGLVGSLYQKGDRRSEVGFSIFYFWLNVGAFLSRIIVGIVADWRGFHSGFTSAGMGMLGSVLILILGKKYLEKNKKSTTSISNNKSQLYIFASILLTSAIALGIIWISTNYSIVKFSDVELGFLFIIILAPLLIIKFILKLISDKSLNVITRNDMRVILLIIIAIYTDCIVQGLSGSFFITYTKNHINHTNKLAIFFGYSKIPTTFYASVKAFFSIILVKIVSSTCSFITIGKKPKASILTLMGLGIIALSLSCISFTFGETQRIQLISVMGKNYKIAPWFLLTSYFLNVISQLIIFPGAFSYITQVAPKNLRSTLIGILFGIIGCGGGMAGELGAVACKYGILHVFTFLSISTASIGFLYIILDQKVSFSPIRRSENSNTT